MPPPSRLPVRRSRRGQPMVRPPVPNGSPLEAEHRDGLPAEQSIVQAAHVRFRPIMMTTMAALVGSLPVAMATGAGAESRRPLGIVVVGGLLFSQLITLYITPVIYTYLDPFNRKVARRLAREERTQPEAHLAPAVS